ncbi:VWA domain-containing protein [Candidatus Poribacteria bacterium]|nr:VWA domain-containing protein [Candidatus Poribacteria bacterium]
MWGISFLNPVFLFGMLAAALPLLIHFLIKKKVDIMPFSFINFLESVNQKRLQHFKLSKILLLILRILILVLVALALAKPFFRNYSDAFFTDAEGSSVIILLDNSYSMSMIDTNVTRWQRSKQAAHEIVNIMSPRDEVAIIPFSNLVSYDIHNFTKDKTFLLNELDKLNISHYSTNVSNGFKAANLLFKKSQNQIKKIILITDMQRNGWDGISQDFIPQDIKINIINVGQKNASNLAIMKLDTPVLSIKGQLVRFTVFVKNFSTQSVENKILSLVIGGQKVNNQRINLEPGESKKMDLYYTFSSIGVHTGYIELTEDLMPIDNRFYFCMNVVDKLKILSVSGKTNNAEEKSEAFYFNVAVNPPNIENILFKVKEIKQDELGKVEFSDFDIFVLANVSYLSNIQLKVMEECVKRGSGVLFFLGDKINTEEYNKEIYHDGFGLLPGKITYQINSSGNKNTEIGQYFYIDKIEKEHLIFSVFVENTFNALQKIPFYSFYRVEANELAKDIKILARYNDGLPALIEKEYGNGRVLLFTSSISLNWNILPLQGIFPTLIHQFINYLSLQNQSKKMNYFVGDNDIPQKITDITAGIHKIVKNDKEEFYAVNLNTRESDLNIIDEKEVLDKINSGYTRVSFSSPIHSSNIALYDNWFKGEIWKLLLFIILFLIIAETLVANKREL